MKKLISSVLILLLLAASAFAEENVIRYDPAIFEALGIEMQTVSLNDFGMQFDLPAEMLETELSETNRIGGTIAAYAAPDMRSMMSVGFAQMVDMEGKPFADYDALAAYYRMCGADGLEILDVNGLYALTYAIADADILGTVYLFENSYVLSFNFAPFSDQDFVSVAACIMASVRPAE